jgi:hypothetical protein
LSACIAQLPGGRMRWNEGIAPHVCIFEVATRRVAYDAAVRNRRKR